jgi:signal transduction histidine kinase
VIRHADAKHAGVELEFTDSNLSIRIRDDGKGFVVPIDPAAFPKHGHFGLLGLQERAEIIKADFRIKSNPGDGTVVFINVRTL